MHEAESSQCHDEQCQHDALIGCEAKLRSFKLRKHLRNVGGVVGDTDAIECTGS